MAHGSARMTFPGARHVYGVFSSRARGFAVGIDLTPNGRCNFDCRYCETAPAQGSRGNTPEPVDAGTIAAELESALLYIEELRRTSPTFEMAPLAHVAISGSGEPTLCPNFAEAMEAIVHLRAVGRVPFFKLVLLTNATELGAPEVCAGLRLFTRVDNVWAKLDVGTQAAMDRINRSSVPLDRTLDSILQHARQRPVVIQSMFVELDGKPPSADELVDYANCLARLKADGAQISLVQVYSATRPPHGAQCRHLSLRALGEIAAVVRRLTGLPVEVF